MALTPEVQQLVNDKKWTEAYEKASSQRTSSSGDLYDELYLIAIDSSITNEEGFVKGDANDFLNGKVDNFQIIKEPKDATLLNKKDAEKVASEIKKQDKKKKQDSKQYDTEIVLRNDLLGAEVGSQGTEKGDVINLFLAQRFEKGSGDSKRKLDISKSKDVLVKQIEELGFNYNDNPFLQFIDIFAETTKTTELTLNEITIINDLYANGVIKTNELQGKTFEASNTIIFNKNLYKTEYEDAEFIVQAYKWLSNENNIKRYLTNSKAMTKYNIEDIQSVTRDKAIEIRNLIIFNSSTDTINVVTDEIHTVSDIQRETRFLESETSTLDTTASAGGTLNVATKVNDVNRWSELIANKGLTAQEAQDLISYLAREYKLV